MIHFSFGINNPFSKREFQSKTLYYREFGYKSFLIEYMRDNSIIDFWLRWTIKQSHAGIMFSFGLLSYEISFQFEDSRHWNELTNDWEKYD